ncbi:YqhR family membrane protein [Brevibacillus sp. 179-C9.3 HS]|uniref:YqhR family membrane protein n=1 Tax=unclassified Brevibacillus TaxID=2684853 RepID=UPI00399FF71D
MEASKTGRRQKQARVSHTEEGKQASNRISTSKILEVAFWGTIIWGLIRLIGHFLNLTPYGIGAFARPLINIEDENTFSSMCLGAIVLFVETVVASFVFAFLFSRIHAWWLGLVYGAVLLLVAGFFFHIGNWEVATLSTEGAWYLTFGLFIGMTLMLEQSDDTHAWDGATR